jgi:hypothetical protein
VVVRDLDLEGIATLPAKADPELTIDPDAVGSGRSPRSDSSRFPGGKAKSRTSRTLSI